MTRRPLALACLFCLILVAGGVSAQTGPVNGMRPVELGCHALTNATIITAPGERIEQATIIVRDSAIEQVGTDVDPPADARVWDCTGLMIYPGLIDAAVFVDVEGPTAQDGSHWNPRVHPEWSMLDMSEPSSSIRESMRKIGFTVAAVYPEDGAFKGTGAILPLAEDDEHVRPYHRTAPMAMELEYSGGWTQRLYPAAAMGGVALVRQTLYDARWHARCRAAYEANSVGDPPIRADALVALDSVMRHEQPIVCRVKDEHELLRAARTLREFDLDATFIGSGGEYRWLDAIAGLAWPIIVPVDFPERPDIASPADADDLTLRALLDWDIAPSNPQRLIRAGVVTALTTHGLDAPRDFPKRIREAKDAGLTDDELLAALTTTPAMLLGHEHIIGTIEHGKAANLAVVDGPLFDKDTRHIETWVNGRRHEINPRPGLELTGPIELRIPDLGVTLMGEISTKDRSLKITSDDEKTVKASKITRLQDQFSAIVNADIIDSTGYVVLAGTLTEAGVNGAIALPSGAKVRFTIMPTKPETTDDQPPGDEAVDVTTDDDEAPDAVLTDAPLMTPVGAFGVRSLPEQQTLLVENATIWTCTGEPPLDNAWMVVRDGTIASIGTGESPVRGFDVRIDATGKHVTPGLVDCHSHTGIMGGVNEWTQTNSAEVRIADCIDPDDVNWYRQLAGGLTAVNQLHGSANPIGGQNSVVKIKWGHPASDYPIRDASPGIKFALGENVKRRTGRYPDTRMGVETFIRDAFSAAVDYRDAWSRWHALDDDAKNTTMPPRRDLELEALVEIIEGERLVHCHSYRQDEILMLIRVAEEFGFTIGTFQHVLEGYKVADAIAEHGAGGSSFSDWWMYKVEVMDAIPHNGSLMTSVGVLTSFNSDSDELARRMNIEAAKAVRYGGMTPHDALLLVTLNPAMQLRIDHRVGSLEEGKDADFVIWSGDPLSVYSVCEQTWIEGAKYFDREDDLERRAQAKAERQRLIQKVLADAHGDVASLSDDEDEDKGEDETAETHPTDQLAAEDALPPGVSAWFVEQMRQGQSTDTMHPGDCGCLIHDLLERYGL